jgi:hypothetical protein
MPNISAMLLVALYLILAGASHFGVGFRYMNIVMGILALAAGVLLLLGR